MALEATFTELHERLLALRETLQAAQVTIREDKPLSDDILLVDQIGDGVDDLLGWLEEAITDAHTCQQAIEQRSDIYETCRALIRCQERIDKICQHLLSDVIHYQRIAELTRLGRKRGGEWRSWAGSVIQSFEDCSQPLFEVQRRLLDCWQELADQVGTIMRFMQSVHCQLLPTASAIVVAD